MVQPQNQPAQPQRPMSIFEVINENVNVTNQNVLTLIKKVDDLAQKFEASQQEIVALSLMFKAPEQPNVAPGEEGAKTEK